MTFVAKAVFVAWVTICAAHWNTDPALLLAVAHIESRIGHHEFRFGRMSKSFYGPFGIHRCFKKKWHIEEWPVNVWIGAKCFRNIWSKKAAKRRLRKYNTAFNMAYWNEIKKAWKKYKRELKHGTKFRSSGR